MKKLYFFTVITLLSLSASAADIANAVKTSIAPVSKAASAETSRVVSFDRIVKATNPSAVNLVQNPSFEASASAATGWGQWSPNNSANMSKVVVGAGKTGTNFLRIDAPCDLLRFQDVRGIEAGLYSLKAWVRSSGNLSYAVLYGRGFDVVTTAQGVQNAPDVTTALGIATNTWTQIVINNINVTTGRMEVGMQIVGSAAGQWVEVDDIELVASAFVPQNFVRNPGFEANNAAVVSPANWGKWPAANGAQATVVSGASRSGNYHARITGPSDVLFLQGVSSLANGTYTFKGWFRNSGPIGYARLFLKNFGGAQIERNVGVSMTDWTEITVPDINVTTGTLQIDVQSVSIEGDFLELDDFSLTLNPSLSKSSFSFDAISVYPNPVANNLLNISNPYPEKYEVSLFNLLGQKLFVESNIFGSKTIDTSFLPSGSYLLLLSNAAGSIGKKIVVP